MFLPALLLLGLLACCDEHGSRPAARPTPMATPRRAAPLPSPAAPVHPARTALPPPSSTVRPPGIPRAAARALPGLLRWRAASLAPGVVAVLGGADGATLFPFQRAARSRDGGRTFTAVEVPREGGVQSYAGGFLVLPDGRLLALLDHWSDDVGGHASPRHHGLYVSRGDDWSAYAPFAARFAPPLVPAPRGYSSLDSLTGSRRNGGVVVVGTWDRRTYVSTDGARTFHTR
ncbi:MAG: sialidase family protein [Nocardioides sp.]